MPHAFGKTVEDSVDGFMLKATGAVVAKTGQEYVLPLPIIHEMNKISKKTNNNETIRAIASQKFRADSFYMWSHLELAMSCEIKCYTTDNLTDIHSIINREFFSNDWHVYKQNFGVRLIVVDLRNRLLRSLNSNVDISIEQQQQNWNEPWTWIPNIEDANHFKEEFEKHFIRPLSLCTKKILGQIDG